MEGVKMNKFCTGCERDLPATSNYFHRKNRGFATRCKECIKAYYNRYYTENHERVKNSKNEMSKEYYNKNKKEISVRRKQQFKDGSTAKRAWSIRNYQENRERFLQQRKDFLKTDHGKAEKRKHDQIRRAKGMKLQADFNANDWKACKNHFNGCCAYCGKEKELTREHFIPLVNKGEYTINNIIPACKSCNCSKSKSDFFEWYPKHKSYSKQREQKILKYLNYDKNNMQQLALL